MSAKFEANKCRTCGVSFNHEENHSHVREQAKPVPFWEIANAEALRCSHLKVQREFRGRRIIYRCLRCFQLTPSNYFRFCPVR